MVQVTVNTRTFCAVRNFFAQKDWTTIGRSSLRGTHGAGAELVTLARKYAAASSQSISSPVRLISRISGSRPLISTRSLSPFNFNSGSLQGFNCQDIRADARSPAPRRSSVKTRSEVP